MNIVLLCFLLLKGTFTAFAGLASLPVKRPAAAHRQHEPNRVKSL